MAVIRAQRTSQMLLDAELTFNYNDTATDSVALVSKTFGSAFADNIVFDGINLPRGAQIVGGSVVVETPGVGPTAYTIAVGTPASPACYLAASSLTAAASTRYPLLLTSVLASLDGSNVRITIASTVANATAGRFRLNIQYKIDGKGGTDVSPS